MLKFVLTNLKDHSVLNVGYFSTPWKCKIKFATPILMPLILVVLIF